MFFKIGVLKNFANFTEKNTCAEISADDRERQPYSRNINSFNAKNAII